MNARVVLVALALAGCLLFGASVRVSMAPAAIGLMVASQTVPANSAAAPTARSITRLPTAAPEREATVATSSTPRADREAASLPRRDASAQFATVPPVTPTREPARTGCDPAYPDPRTCIPPGPPFDQGCAITPERRFTVLAPDPQALDHDADGIGCEPITN